MIITFKEALSRKTWLQKELMNSLTDECFNTLKEGETEWDVKLLVNNVEIEPIWFNSIMTKLEEHITAEANILFEEMLENKKELLQSKSQELLDKFEEIRSDLLF